MVFQLILAAGLTVTAATAASGGAPSIEQAAIVAQSQRLDRGFERKDFSAWRHVLADGFRVNSPGEKPLTKQQFINEAMREVAAALEPISVQIKPAEIRTKGARGNGMWRELTCYGVRDKHKLRRRFCYRQSFRDGWEKVGNEWLETRIDYSSGSKFFLDGKRISRRQVRQMLGH